MFTSSIFKWWSMTLCPTEEEKKSTKLRGEKRTNTPLWQVKSHALTDVCWNMRIQLKFISYAHLCRYLWLQSIPSSLRCCVLLLWSLSSPGEGKGEPYNQPTNHQRRLTRYRKNICSDYSSSVRTLKRSVLGVIFVCLNLSIEWRQAVRIHVVEIRYILHHRHCRLNYRGCNWVRTDKIPTDKPLQIHSNIGLCTTYSFLFKHTRDCDFCRSKCDSMAGSVLYAARRIVNEVSCFLMGQCDRPAQHTTTRKCAPMVHGSCAKVWWSRHEAAFFRLRQPKQVAKLRPKTAEKTGSARRGLVRQPSLKASLVLGLGKSKVLPILVYVYFSLLKLLSLCWRACSYRQCTASWQWRGR